MASTGGGLGGEKKSSAASEGRKEREEARSEETESEKTRNEISPLPRVEVPAYRARKKSEGNEEKASYLSRA